ncbi:hypothetical protein [Bradyrhizobium nanningense]|uniref:hypothetical protein n=1 Tax=Bradyrhizobium nanningense TaxID=1325118 RepID=UPI003D316D97
MGHAAFHLRLLHERLLTVLRARSKLFADQTTVFDPGRGRTTRAAVGLCGRRQDLERPRSTRHRLNLCTRPQSRAAVQPFCRL